MKPILRIDFETRSVVDPGGKKGVGLWNYFHHPTTSLLMLAWAYGDDEPQLWKIAEGEPMPERLRKGLEDPDQIIGAFNSAFERYALQFKLGYIIPASRFEDSQPAGRMLSLPASLDDMTKILRLPAQFQKDARGHELIQLFSKPNNLREMKKGVESKFNDWTTHPTEWAEFENYCLQDVVAERELAKRLTLLQVLPMSSFERKVWLFDQKVNDRGIKVDRAFVENMLKLGDRAKKEAEDELRQLTGIQKPNGIALLPWVQTQGYKEDSLEKDVIKIVLASPETVITDECREVLKKRLISGSSSYRKMAAIIRNLNEDDRLRGQFVYMGAARSGRFSGNAVQMQNLARPDKDFEELEALEEAREFVKNLDYNGMVARYGKGDVLRVIKNCIRTVFIPAEGKRLNVCDKAAIETRVAAWLVNCQTLLDVFRENKDPYVAFAVYMAQLPYEILITMLKSKDAAQKAQAKEYRQWGKAGVLGSVFSIAAEGLRKFAEKQGIILTFEKCEEIVRVFRSVYSEIVKFWYDSARAVEKVIKSPNPSISIWIGEFIKIDKLTIQGWDNPILRIHLPSGRALHYLEARWAPAKMPWKEKVYNEKGVVIEEKEVWRDSFIYAGVNQDTKQWEHRTTSHGGKILENVTQGTARDVLVDDLVVLDEQYPDLEFVGHVHDEGIAESDDSPFAPGLLEMQHQMSQPISWAPGLILGADGFEAKFYHK